VRVILAGQKSFGAAVYEMLLAEGHDIAAVWSPVLEDGWSGNDKLTTIARRDDLLEPPAFRKPGSVTSLDVDLFVAAHSHDFIGRQSRQATKLGGIGYHPSLLPRHRGRDAVEWTIRMGDPIAGGSVYWLTDQVDGGPIARQDYCHVEPGWDASKLWREELFPMGLRLLSQTLYDLDHGLVVEIPQNERCATWEPSLDAAPLYRPELPQIGTGVNGYEHVTTRRR
jgi:methionyl-tRNA formyltransferase